jgi:hypothetical protein
VIAWLRNPEVIGPPDCPILHRWTLLDLGPRVGKLMVHHFLPNADDRDVHDHPRPFWTYIVRGGYDDLVPCECAGTAWEGCAGCVGRGGLPGLRIGDRMRGGMLRRRPAEHAHRTRVGPRGCWTIVVMGPLQRRWGFWRRGKWWFWRDYEAEFGFAMRCEDLDKEYRRGEGSA